MGGNAMKRKISIIVTVFIMMLCFTLVFANALDEVPSGQLAVTIWPSLRLLI